MVLQHEMPKQLEQLSCFSCSVNNFCCKLKVKLSLRDVLKIFLAFRLLPGTYSEKFEGYRIIRRISGSCYFLDDGRCRIYRARPKICRKFGYKNNDECRNVARRMRMLDNFSM